MGLLCLLGAALDFPPCFRKFCSSPVWCLKHRDCRKFTPFFSICFSCCPELPQPISRAGPFAQCPPRPWLEVSSRVSSSCRQRAQCQHCLPSPGKAGAPPGFLQPGLQGEAPAFPRSCFLVPFPSISAPVWEQVQDFLVDLSAQGSADSATSAGLCCLLGNSHLLVCEELKSVVYF